MIFIGFLVVSRSTINSLVVTFLSSQVSKWTFRGYKCFDQLSKIDPCMHTWQNIRSFSLSYRAHGNSLTQLLWNSLDLFPSQSFLFFFLFASFSDSLSSLCWLLETPKLNKVACFLLLIIRLLDNQSNSLFFFKWNAWKYIDMTKKNW